MPTRFDLRTALPLLTCLVALGCSGADQRAASVDPVRAREALTTVLESWKKGERPEALKTASPPIVVQDFDWMGGLTLVSYKVKGDGKDDDANLRVPVALVLKGTGGGQQEKTVSYVVGTSPTITVFRDFP